MTTSPKTERLELRLTPQQLATLKLLAASAKLTISAFILDRCLDPSTSVHPELALPSAVQPRHDTTINPSKLCPRCQRFGQPACNPCRKLLSP